MATAITADLVKTLRDKTGAGMMECKVALTEAKGDLEEATTILRKRGLAQAAKKAGRTTGQGVVEWTADGKVERYEGDVVAGRRNGRGVATSSDGHRYEGKQGLGDSHDVLDPRAR